MKAFISVGILSVASIFSLQSVFGQNKTKYQYVFPKPNSQLVSRETNIIIRPGNRIDRSSLAKSAAIEVVGSRSGRHEASIILSDDERSIVFNPNVPFADDERVAVRVSDGMKGVDGTSIQGTTFEFSTSARLIYRIAGGTDNIVSELPGAHSQNGAWMVSALADSVPADFPPIRVDTINNAASGELFVGGFSGNGGTTAYANYALILNNAGKPLAYKRIGTGINPFEYMFKVEPNGVYSYIERSPVVTSVKIVDSAFNTLDGYPKGNPATTSHADFLLLPNGHALVLYFDIKTIDMSKIVKGGNPAASVWGNLIQEFDLNKNVVFQWSSFDYLPITDTYEDTLAASFDYSHANGVELDTDGNLMISNRHLSEITKIDRNTGEVIWRLGGKRNQFTFINEHQENAPTYFSYMHNIKRLPNGNITVLDNGNQHKPQYSRAVEYKLDEVNKTATLVWEYRHTPDIFASAHGCVQRLPNGNTFIGWGDAGLQGKPAITEIHPDKSLAFELSLPVGYRAMRVYRLPWKPWTLAGSRTINELLQGNSYSFNDTSGTGRTGVRIKFNSLTGTFYNTATVEKYTTAPMKPQFAGRSPWMGSYRVTISQFGMATLDADVIFDIGQYSGLPDPAAVKIYRRDTVGSGIFSELPTSYNSVTKELVSSTTRFGEFVFCWQDSDSSAGAPIMLLPLNRDSVNQKTPVVFGWNPRGTITSYNLQVARDSLFKNLILNDSLLTGTSDTLKAVTPNSMFFWRVRARNFGQTSAWSEVRIFTTTSPYISITSPAGKETWQRGLPSFIQWRSNIKEAVRIDLIRGTNRLLTVKDSVSNVGAFSWTIPSSTSPDSTYRIKVTSVADSSVYGISLNAFSIGSGATNVAESGSTPTVYMLFQNYPNPFNPTTTISYQVSVVSVVTLGVYDVLGREVAMILRGVQAAGIQSVRWNASALPSGVYYYRLQAQPVAGQQGPFVESRKMVLMK